jgi:hypothetical protein
MENRLATLRAEISDLRQQLREEREERKALIDRLIAATAPGALREARRVPPAPGEGPADTGLKRHGINFPGYEPNLRPPTPKPPQALSNQG